MAVVTVVAAAIALVVTQRFYFYDDTQSYSIGTWYTFGERLRAGDFSFLQLRTWSSGNVLVEGQWGAFNPVLIAVSLGATVVGNLGLYATLYKFALLVVAAIGAHRLALLMDAGRKNAFIVGCAVPLGGFTVYMDAATWVNGLLAWACFIWVWVAVVQLRAGRWGYLPLYGFIFLGISVGYAHATVLTLTLFGSYLLVDLWRRTWPMAAQMVVALVATVGVAALIFLPAALSAGVTNRGQKGIASSGFWGPDLSDLATMTALVPGVEIPGYLKTSLLLVPLFYVSWAVPLLLVGVSDRIRGLRFAWPTVVFAVASALLLLGPTEVGPLRYPVRVMPYVALGILLILVQGSRDTQWTTIAERSVARNVLWFAPLPVLGAWLTFSDIPGLVVGQVLGLLVVMAGLALLAWLCTAGKPGGLVVAAFVAVTLLATGVSRFYAPSPRVSDFELPAATSRLQVQLPGAAGQTFVVGDLSGAPVPMLWEESLLARTWQINPVPVQNSYTVIPVTDYVETLEMSHLGLTPASTLDVLFEAEAETGRPLVDLMQIQNIQLWKHSFGDPGLPDPPEGWSVAQDQRYTRLWTREASVDPVGGVSFASPGVSATEVSRSPDRIVLDVSNDSSDDGLVVLSRLDWPGYSVAGLSQAQSPAGFLLAVDVPAGTPRTQVEVAYRPPGLRLGLVAAVLGAVIVLLAELRRRRRRTGVSAD